MKCPGCGIHIASERQASCKMCGTDLRPKASHGAAEAAPSSPSAAPARAAARPDWRRHMFVRVGAPPVELKVGLRFTIGRASDAQLSIPSPRVSRAHAEVSWHDGAAVLRDLGSQNGTTVNGVRVTEHTLQDGDELAIGPYACTYRCMSGYGSVGKLQGLLDTALQTKPMLGDSLSGQLAQTSLFEVLQMLEVGQKTGQVDVLREDRGGKVVLDEGRIIHASEGELAGVVALHELLGWSEGLFRYTNAVEGDPAQNLPGTQTVLMFEAARRMGLPG